MRKGSQLHDYNLAELAFGLTAAKQALGWSYRQIAQELLTHDQVVIDPGTLHHVERSKRPIPDEQRFALERLIARVGILEQSGLTETEGVLGVSSEPQNEPNFAPGYDWQAEEIRLLQLARDATQREDWNTWAEYIAQASVAKLSMGELDTAQNLLNVIFRGDLRRFTPITLADVLKHQGWVAMEQSRFASAANYLRQSEAIAQEAQYPEGVVGARHFLGRVYCAWGVIKDDPVYRDVGRAYLKRALADDQQAHNDHGIGYDLLQQAPSLAEDHPRRARLYLAKSLELLGSRGSPLGHYHLDTGLVNVIGNPRAARDHFELACVAYSDGIFYPKGLAAALRSLCMLEEETTATLPQAAAHALAAMLLHPYIQSRAWLERVATRTLEKLCDSSESRFIVFWRGLAEQAQRMREAPFTLLAPLKTTARGRENLRRATLRAEEVIFQAAPWLERAPLLIHGDTVESR